MSVRTRTGRRHPGLDLAGRLAVLMSVLVVPATAAAQTPARLTVDDAVALAVEGNRTLKAATLEATRAGEERDAMLTHRFPVLDTKSLVGTSLAPFTLTFPAGSLGSYPPIGPIPSVDTEISSPVKPMIGLFVTATQPLTQLRRIDLGAKALGAAQHIAAEEVRSRRLELVTRVRKVCYGLLQAQAARGALDEAATLLTELRRVVGEYADREVVLPADRLAVEARLAQTDLQRAKVENTIVSLSEQLNVLLGRDPSTPVEIVPPSPPVAEPDIARAQARALEARPEVREADLRATQAGFNVRLKQEAYVPEVSIMASYLGLYNVDIVPEHTAAVGLFFSWEPFDWGRRKLEKQAAQHQADAAALAQAETRALIRVDVAARHRHVHEARLALAAADADDALSREKLRVARERLGQQAALLKDVLDAQVARADTVQRRQQAELELWTAIAELDQAIGDSAP